MNFIALQPRRPSRPHPDLRRHTGNEIQGFTLQAGQLRVDINGLVLALGANRVRAGDRIGSLTESGARQRREPPSGRSTTFAGLFRLF